MQGSNPYACAADALAGTPFARIDYAEETGSTNADAAALLGDESAAGRTIVAEHQTRGTGRKGRSWTARPGTALLCTTILPHPIPTGNLWVVPYWAALAARAALLTCGIGVTLHWPNDLLLDERKLGGILCQSRVTGEKAWVACGVGVNAFRKSGAEAGIDPPPAFCDDVAPVDRVLLLRAILREYDATLALLEAPERAAKLWEGAAGLPGRRYRILKDGEAAPFEATALELASNGGLVVAHDDGSRETIALADARALR